MAEMTEQRSIPRRLKPEEVYLVLALDLGLSPEIGVLTPKDVVGPHGEYSTRDIVAGFIDDHRLDRLADVLGRCVGTKRPIAVLKDVDDAEEDLNKAFRSKATTEAELLEEAKTEDLLRHHGCVRANALCFRGRWPDRRTEGHKLYMKALMRATLELKLLTHHELIKAIGWKLLSSRRTPEEILCRLLETAEAMGEAAEKRRTERDQDPGKAKEPAAERPFQSTHIVGIFTTDLMVDCFDLTDCERVHLAVAEKYHWLPKAPTAVEDDESHPTRRPAAMDDGPVATQQLDEPGTPAESIAPPAAPAPASQANEEDVEIIFDGDGGTGTHAVPPPSGEAPPLPSPKPRTEQELTPENVDAAFDALIEEDKKDVPSTIPLSKPGEGTMVVAASKDVADQWKGKAPAGGATPGSGSRSSSSLKPR